MVTRRVLRRQLRLRPEESVNEILLYILAVAARKYDIRIHCFQFLSNHFHLVFSYTRKRLPRFMQYFDGLVGRALNCHQGLWETFWAPGSYNSLHLTDDETVLRYMLYVLTNAVEAGLVKSAKEWPGLKILPHEIGHSIRARQPGSFCDPNGPLPEGVTLKTCMPRMDSMSSEKAQARLSSAWKLREETIREDYKAKGRSFLGARKVCKQSPLDYPKGGEPRRNMNPRVTAVNKWTRLEKVKAMVKFVADYTAAMAAFCSGDRTVTFPSGTYEMHVLFGACCEDPVPT
jgi:REP element-mobilizing transposase RayT